MARRGHTSQGRSEGEPPWLAVCFAVHTNHDTRTCAYLDACVRAVVCGIVMWHGRRGLGFQLSFFWTNNSGSYRETRVRRLRVAYLFICAAESCGFAQTRNFLLAVLSGAGYPLMEGIKVLDNAIDEPIIGQHSTRYTGILALHAKSALGTLGRALAECSI